MPVEMRVEIHPPEDILFTSDRLDFEGFRAVVVELPDDGEAGSGQRGIPAIGAWTGIVNSISVLVCIFALGTGLALAAPVMGAIIPDIVDSEELPSAITLGGARMNLAGIVSPALAGVLLPLIGALRLIFYQCLDVSPGRFCRPAMEAAPEGLDYSPRELHRLFYQCTALRSPFAGHELVHFRNLLFSLVISISPALLPLIALKEIHLSASQPGLVFTSVGVGSLAGAVFALLYLRQRTSKCNDLNLYGDHDRRAAGAVFHAPIARLDGLRNTGGRGLGARRL